MSQRESGGFKGQSESAQTDRSRRFATTTRWHVVRQSRAIESCDEEPWARGESSLSPVCLARLSGTWRDFERSIGLWKSEHSTGWGGGINEQLKEGSLLILPGVVYPLVLGWYFLTQVGTKIKCAWHEIIVPARNGHNGWLEDKLSVALVQQTS